MVGSYLNIVYTVKGRLISWTFSKGYLFHEHIFQGLLILHDRYKKILLSFYKVNLGIFKGTVQQDFRPPVFYIIRTGLSHWPVTNGLKYFCFWFSFCWDIRIFQSSAQYDTAWSQVPRSIKLPGVKFTVVSYCAESSSPQYHTARSQVPRSIIPRGVTLYCAESTPTY